MKLKIFLVITVFLSIFSCKKECVCPVPEETCKAKLDSGLIVYFPFNGNTNDESGNGNNATAFNGAFLTTDYLGRTNSAAGFDGINDYLKVPGSAKLNSPQFTVSFQVMVNSSNRRNAGISRINFSEGKGVTYGIHESLSTDNKWNYAVLPSGDDCEKKYPYDTSVAVYSNPPIQAGRWYNVIATFGDGEQKIYVNGVLQGMRTRDFNTLKMCENADLIIGGWWSADIVSIDGKIDEVRIYNRVISDCEISELSKVFNEEDD